jgi:hypothetical protein
LKEIRRCDAALQSSVCQLGRRLRRCGRLMPNCANFAWWIIHEVRYLVLQAAAAAVMALHGGSSMASVLSPSGTFSGVILVW